MYLPGLLPSRLLRSHILGRVGQRSGVDYLSEIVPEICFQPMPQFTHSNAHKLQESFPASVLSRSIESRCRIKVTAAHTHGEVSKQQATVLIDSGMNAEQFERPRLDPRHTSLFADARRT